MEMESNPSCGSEPIHMSDTATKVTDILSDRLGVLTTVASKERILFDIEELYLADEKCDSSRPLSSYVTPGTTELQCDASFLPGDNKWNIQYKATCVWRHKKPPFIQIFGRHISNCSATVRLIPGYIYEGHIVQVSPPNAALAVLILNNISFPVLIFLNRLFRNSSLKKLQNCEWIQDHLNVGDKVEFEFETIERKSVHKNFHVPAFAWKSELQEQRKHTDEQKDQHDSDVNGVKWHRRDSQVGNTVSNVATLEVTNSKVTCVGISDVGTHTETSGGTPLAEPPVKRCGNETVEASEPANNTPLLLYGETKLKECEIYTARESVHGISEGKYGAVSLYRILQSAQNDTEGHLHLSGTGIVRNDCKVHMVHPHFSYELLKPPDITEFQFRATLTGFVIFSYAASGLPKCRKSHLPADEVLSNTQVRILPEPSHKQCRMPTSSADLGIELEMPLDPLNSIHVAVPRTPSSAYSGMTAYLTGISLPECVSYDVSTLTSDDCLQIPVCLYKLPAHNPTSAYKAVTLQGKFPMNSSTVALDSTETVCDKQSHDLNSCIQDTLSQEVASDPFCELQSKLSGHKEVLMQTCERKSSKSFWDTPLILVPVFVPLSLHSSSERTSLLPSTRWTLISGSVATEKHCLMYVPSSALPFSAQSDKQHTQSPDQPSEDNFISPEELYTSKSHSGHFGKYTGSICSFGYDHGRVAFTVDGKMEIALFYRKKVYVNGTRICSQSKLCDVLSLGMPVTLNVKPYEGESFIYKATAVYVVLSDDEQLEVCEGASKQKAASDVVSVNSDSTKLSHGSLQNATNPLDQVGTNNECLALKCWDNFCAENTGVRKHMKESVNSPRAYESNLTNRESCKDLAAGMITSPGKDTNITQSSITARQETAVNAHLAEETSNVSTGVLRSEEKTVIPKDDQEKVAVSKFDTEFKPPDIVKPSLIIGKVIGSDYATGELSTSKITLNITSPLELLPQSSAQITDKIISDNDPGELFTCETNTSDIASSVGLLPQSATQITDKIISDNDPGELFTCETNTSDIASSVGLLPQSATQITDKTVSDNDPGELFTCETNTSDVASAVDLLPQSATQITDKTISDNDPGELFTCETNTSAVASAVDLLPQSATNVAGVIDDVWMNNAVLMTAKLKQVKAIVLIYGRNLYIKRKRCNLTNTGWQHSVQGMQVCADISKLNGHPSGAVYMASSAWNGKKPGHGRVCNITPCGTETCVNCLKKVFSSEVDPSTSESKAKSDAGKKKSNHCKKDGIKYPTENTGTCRKKPVPNDKSCCVQGKVDAAAEKKQKYYKALRSMNSLVGNKYVGRVERYAVDDGFGLVNFHLENGKAKAVFFRQYIFAKGISVTDSYVKDSITAGRLVTVSAVKPCNLEGIPYAVNIDTELHDTRGEAATLSYSFAAACNTEQEEGTSAVEDLECQSSKFSVKEREMFYKRRLSYNWDQGSVRDSDRCQDTEVTDHPEEVELEKRWCWDTTVSGADAAARSNTKVEVRCHPNELKMEKPLCLEKLIRDANKTASLDKKDTEVPDHSDEVKADKPLCQEGAVGGEIKTDNPSCQEETVGNAVVNPSSGNQRLMHLPVTSTPRTGLAKQLKEKLARVKRYESSTRGILEYSISGAVLEIEFDRSVVKFCGENEITDMREHLPANSVVHFDGEVIGEDSLLGCSDIVVTSVSQSESHRKPTNSKLNHSLTLELPFSSLHKGLVTGRTYEGFITKINPPLAFVATVTENGKNYDVFVFNTFFSPAEYGAKLPAKHSVLPYVAKGYRVHLMVERTQEVNSKYSYEWFAVDAWTEAGENSSVGNTHKVWNTSKELDIHLEGVMNGDHDYHEDVTDADHEYQEDVTDADHEYQEGVVMTLYPDWGALKADHLKDEVTFFAQETFLFGVRLTCVDLRKVFRPGDKLCFTMLEENAVKKVYRVWLGAHDTPLDNPGFAARTLKIVKYCTSHNIEQSVVVTLLNELGKLRNHMKVGGRIQTSSPEDDDDDDAEDMWLEQDSSCMASACCGGVIPDDSEHSNYIQVYHSDNSSDSDTGSVYVSDEVEENHEVSGKESSVDQLGSSETGMPCSSNNVTTVCTTADASSSVSTLERAELFHHKGSLKDGTANQESEHDTLPITIGATKNNKPIVPVTRTSDQQRMLHAQNRIIADSHTCTDEATSLSTDHCKREVSRCPVLHPEMQENLRLLLYEACQKYNIELDVSKLIVSEAVTAVEEELKGVLRGKLLDRVLNKVTNLVSDSNTDQKATPHMFETLTEVSKEWKQNLSEFLLVGSVPVGLNTEQEVVDDRTQLRSSHTRTVHVQAGGLVDKAVQTVSTGSVLFLKVLPNS